VEGTVADGTNDSSRNKMENHLNTQPRPGYRSRSSYQWVKRAAEVEGADRNCDERTR